MGGRKYLCALNPDSGRSKARKMMKSLQQDLPNDDFLVLESISPGYFSRFINQNILSDIDAVIVLGGDGTMHDVVNAMYNANSLHIPVILFPAGSGNAFNHDLQCLDYKSALKALKTFKVEKIDLIKVKYEGFECIAFNMIGWGLVANINFRSERLRSIGTSRYTIASLIELIPNPSQKVKVKLDQITYNEDFSFILILNTKHTGKGMKMAPLADLQDELMDVILVRKTSVFNLLKLFPSVYSGKHIQSELLEYKQVRNIMVNSEVSLLTIDGEEKGVAPFTAEIANEKLSIIVQ